MLKCTVCQEEIDSIDLTFTRLMAFESLYCVDCGTKDFRSKNDISVFNVEVEDDICQQGVTL